MKKHSRLRTEDNDEQNNTEFVRKKKKVMKSSSDQSCFVAHVTETNLLEDALYLPQYLTSSAGLKRSCSEIIVRDERERSWALDLRFNEATDTFYIPRGWRSFCDENSKKAGDVIVFKLVENGETPLLSFCSTKSINDGTHKGKKNKEDCVELNREKKRLRCSSRDSIPPSLNRFVTLTLIRGNKLCLPLSFRRENGIDKPGLITVVGKDGSKWDANLIHSSTAESMFFSSKGFKVFAKANGLNNGESFTLEATWENGTPMLRLVSTQSTTDRSQQGESLEKDSVPASLNPFVTLTSFTYDKRGKGKQYLSLPFARENGLDKPGVKTIIGKDGSKWDANLILECKGSMYFGKGWREFGEANGLDNGESFMLEAILENGTPMLRLLSTQSTNDTSQSQQGECSKDSKKESFAAEPSSVNKTMIDTNNREERKESSSAIKSRYVTLTLTPEDIRDSKLILPSQFLKDNDINKLGKITLLGENRMKCLAYLLSKDGFVAVGCDWKGFCEANGVKTGKSFTLGCIHGHDTTHVLKFCSSFGE